MIDHDLKVLEFDRIREFLASFAASPGGRQACLRLAPQTEPERIEQFLRETSEMRDEVDLQGPLPLAGIHAIRSHLEHARINNFYLEPKLLLEISDTMETADMLQRYFTGLADARPLLHALACGIAPLGVITRRIRSSISGQADILDTASPALADIRGRIKKLRLAIIRSLEHMLVDVDLDTAIQDDFITLRNNRYVIPVRSDSRTSIPGVVHDQSQSRATFFVEPLPVVNQNNELQSLRKDEYYEELRILTELTGIIAARSSDIAANLDIAERIDLVHARALFARSLRATCPELNTTGVIALRSCRHPILLSRFTGEPEPEADSAERPPAGSWVFDRSGVVPIDCLKGRGTTTLIITGVNAGGKTVAMKTMGLFVLMAQAGMHLPAEQGSTLPVFDGVFADIGDEQNMEASLSTFSAHMSRIRDIAGQVTPASLVLLDELGSGTDPAEGGALAVAILDWLRARGCTTVATTHLSILKTYAYSRTDAENVSVAFDPATRKPSYSLVYGVPGFSNAIAIARSMGIPDEILQSADSSLSGEDQQAAELMRGLETTQIELSRQKEVLGNVIGLCRKYHNAAKSLHESLRGQRDKILKQFESAARKLLRQSEDELMKILREQKKRTLIRPDGDSKAAGAARSAVAGIKKKLHGQFPAKPENHQPAEHLSPGDSVLVMHLGKTGVVESADNAAKKAVVAIGGLRIKTGFHELAPAPATPPSPARPPKKHAAAAPAAGPASARRVTVIGMRVEEALPVVDKAIDMALVDGAGTLEIIHGRGTGRLRAAIHEHLKTCPSVAGFTPGDPETGGAGLTIVQIK